MSIIASTCTYVQPQSRTSPPPPSLTPPIFLCLSPPEDYTAGYLTPPLQKKCSLEKLYYKRKHNHSSPCISLLPHCSHTLSFPPSLCFSTLFPISGELGSAADGAARQKTLSFCVVPTYSITPACGNSEVEINVVSLC